MDDVRRALTGHHDRWDLLCGAALVTRVQVDVALGCLAPPGWLPVPMAVPVGVPE